jgi:hypothetical protein
MSSEQFSNAIVVHGALVMLPDELVDAGVTCSNYQVDGEPRFPAKGRYQRPVQNLVLHETAGDSNIGPKRKFATGKFAAQLICADTGHVSCHADLAEDILWHGNQLNGYGPGIEFVNPYSPLYDRTPLRATIPRQWWTWVPSMRDPVVAALVQKRGWTAVPQAYCLPTEAQLQTLHLFVPWLCGVLGIPYEFPTKHLSAKQRKIPGWNAKPAAHPGAGVVCHRDYAQHSDGRYLLQALAGVGDD